MVESPEGLHRPLQITQYNTTCTSNYLVTMPHNIHYSFVKLIVLFMFTQHKQQANYNTTNMEKQYKQ